jgi:2'-5' RNA ligase
MRHRIFIAINLPEEIKKELEKFQFKFSELPARWVKPENLHITLAFLGYLTDEELVEVLRITKEVASRHQPFSINLNKILYGPPKMPPRMVWVEGEKSKDLANLQIDLEKSLTSSGKIRFEPEERSFTCHITLARIKQWEFRQIEPEERLQIDEDISFSFEVNSIEVMESQLKRGGAEYTVLESAPLANLHEYGH